MGMKPEKDLAGSILRLFVIGFDKSLFGLALLWFCVTFVQCSQVEAFDLVEVSEVAQRVEKYLARCQTRVIDMPDWISETARSLDRRMVAEATKFPKWLCHNRPNLVFEFAVPGAPELVHKSALVEVTRFHGALEVCWSAPELSAGLLLEHEELQRRKAGKSWETVYSWSRVKTRVGVEPVRKFRDKGVQQNHSYEYRVCSRVGLDLDHAPCARYVERFPERVDVILDASREVFSPVVKAVPKRVWVLIPKHVEVRDGGLDHVVSLEIYVYLASQKSWVRSRFATVKRGEMIQARLRTPRGVRTFDLGRLDSAVVELIPHKTIANHMRRRFQLSVRYADDSVEAFDSDQRWPELTDAR